MDFEPIYPGFESWQAHDFFFVFVFFSSPELAQDELLGYRDVRRPSYVWTSVTSETSVLNFLACIHSRGNSFDPKFMKLCQNVNHHNV